MLGVEPNRLSFGNMRHEHVKGELGNIVGDEDRREVSRLQPCFLAKLARGGIARELAGLESTSNEAPLSLELSEGTTQQEDRLLGVRAENDASDANSRLSTATTCLKEVQGSLCTAFLEVEQSAEKGRNS